jgi:hypothetical protein
MPAISAVKRDQQQPALRLAIRLQKAHRYAAIFGPGQVEEG